MRMQLLTVCAWLPSALDNTTVQAPQSPLAHPSLVSVARNSSRKTSSKVRAGGTLTSEWRR
jgi:starvation-inducible outer membrane lipoprotein